MEATTEAPRRGAPSGHSPEDESSGLHRHMGPVALLFTGVGSIIGSGWLFGALNASILAGPAAIVSWVIGGVMIMLIGLTYAELGTMFPVSGGVVRYPNYAFGAFASFLIGWITWLAVASVAPVEVMAALQYASNNIGGLTHIPDTVGVGRPGSSGSPRFRAVHRLWISLWAELHAWDSRGRDAEARSVSGTGWRARSPRSSGPGRG